MAGTFSFGDSGVTPFASSSGPSPFTGGTMVDSSAVGFADKQATWTEAGLYGAAVITDMYRQGIKDLTPMINVILPYQRSKNPNHQKTKWIFNAQYGGIRGQEGVNNVLTHSKSTDGSSMIWHGLSIEWPLEGFDSPRAKEIIANQIIANARSVAATVALDAVFGMKMHKNVMNEPKYALGAKPSTVLELLNWQKWSFAANVKEKRGRGFYLLLEEIKKTLEKNEMTLTDVVVPDGLPSNVALVYPQRTEEDKAGSDGPNNLKYGDGNMKRIGDYTIWQFPEIFMSDRNQLVQPLKGTYQIGDYMTMVENFPTSGLDEYNTSQRRSVAIYNCDTDSFETIDIATAIDNCQMFDPNGNLSVKLGELADDVDGYARRYGIQIPENEKDCPHMFLVKEWDEEINDYVMRVTNYWGMQNVKYTTPLDQHNQSLTVLYKLQKEHGEALLNNLRDGFKLIEELYSLPFDTNSMPYIQAVYDANQQDPQKKCLKGNRFGFVNPPPFGLEGDRVYLGTTPSKSISSGILSVPSAPTGGRIEGPIPPQGFGCVAGLCTLADVAKKAKNDPVRRGIPEEILSVAKRFESAFNKISATIEKIYPDNLVLGELASNANTPVWMQCVDPKIQKTILYLQNLFDTFKPSCVYYPGGVKEQEPEGSSGSQSPQKSKGGIGSVSFGTGEDGDEEPSELPHKTPQAKSSPKLSKVTQPQMANLKKLDIPWVKAYLKSLDEDAAKQEPGARAKFKYIGYCLLQSLVNYYDDEDKQPASPEKAMEGAADYYEQYKKMLAQHGFKQEIECTDCMCMRLVFNLDFYVTAAAAEGKARQIVPMNPESLNDPLFDIDEYTSKYNADYGSFKWTTYRSMGSKNNLVQKIVENVHMNNRFAEVDLYTRDSVARLLYHLFSFAKVSSKQLHAWAINDCIVPMDFILFRRGITLEMWDVIALNRGKVGRVYFDDTPAIQGQDPATGLTIYSYMWKHDASIEDTDAYMYIRAASPNRYVRGFGVLPVDPNKFSPPYNQDNGSIIFAAMPYGYCNGKRDVPGLKNPIDITGGFAQSLLSRLNGTNKESNNPHYHSALYYCHVYGLHKLHDDYQEQNLPISYNTVCWQGHQETAHWVKSKPNVRKVNTGHLGFNIGPGCKDVLNGAPVPFPDMRYVEAPQVL